MKGRVTFSNRIVSAAVEDDETTGRYFQRQITANPSETRPNTTQTFRVSHARMSFLKSF